MKKILLITALICILYNVNAQALKIERDSVVLTRADSSQEYYVENTTNDSIAIYVINQQERKRKVKLLLYGKAPIMLNIPVISTQFG